MVWLPTFQRDELGCGLGGASAFVAAVIIVNAPGVWLGDWLSSRGAAPALLILRAARVPKLRGRGSTEADHG